MKYKSLLNLLVVVLLLGSATACNHNKIACPTYKDSFPEAKSKKPEAPKALPPGKHHSTSSVLPPGMK